MVPHPSADSSPTVSMGERLDHAVTNLRRRLEQHLDQESRLQGLYHDWQSRWTEHCTGMAHHLTMLEAHLSTWIQHWNPQPRLTVVGCTETAEEARN